MGGGMGIPALRWITTTFRELIRAQENSFSSNLRNHADTHTHAQTCKSIFFKCETFCTGKRRKSEEKKYTHSTNTHTQSQQHTFTSAHHTQPSAELVLLFAAASAYALLGDNTMHNVFRTFTPTHTHTHSSSNGAYKLTFWLRKRTEQRSILCKLCDTLT